MSNHPSEEKIRNMLEEETKEMIHLKEETWEHIQDELFSVQRTKVKSKRFIQLVAILSMAIVIAVIGAGLTTTTGKAIIQNFKDRFIPEKDIELHIEGEREKAHVELEANDPLNYIIYIDKSRYKLTETEAGDRISPEPPLEDEYPEVSMEITQKEMTEKEAIKNIKQEIEHLNMELTREEKVTEPLDAIKISAIGQEYTNEHGKTGVQWDTPVYKYYVTTEGSDQMFIVKQKYFLEAAEGHGVRFDSMLETFEIVQ